MISKTNLIKSVLTTVEVFHHDNCSFLGGFKCDLKKSLVVINVVLSASTINYLCWTDKLLFGDKFFSSFSFVQNEYKDKSPPIPFLKPIAHLWNDINTLSHRSNEKNEFSTLKCDAHQIKRNIFGYQGNGLEVVKYKSIYILALNNVI